MKQWPLVLCMLIISESLLGMKAPTDTVQFFGTDGIRAQVGHSPLSHEQLPRLGQAIARWALEKYGSNPAILIAHDTRSSCAYIKAALTAGMLLHPLSIIDAGVLPTPAAHRLAKTTGYDCALIISASHNPYQDNGIKIIDARTNKLSLADELKISALLQQETDAPSYDSFGTMQSWPNASHAYYQELFAFFKQSFLNGKRIVLDCANGATSFLAPMIFKAFGAEVITIHNDPNGRNINDNCGAVHPQSLAQAVIDHSAFAGFAFDGDGDRIIAVNHAGEIQDGDGILAFLSGHARYRDCSKLVGTVMSNKGFENYLCQKGKNLIRASVGDKYVLAKMVEENLLLGGEPSGHIIMRDYLDSGDGIFTALRILETMLTTGNYKMNEYQHYPQILLNVPIQIKKDLTTPAIQACINQCEQQLANGRLLVRYSGTENVLRIMTEDTTYDNARAVAHQLAQALSLHLQ